MPLYSESQLKSLVRNANLLGHKTDAERWQKKLDDAIANKTHNAKDLSS